MTKLCPISNHPIDIVPHSRNAIQVTCPASHWTSSIFTDIDEAYEFRASLDISKQIAAARREERNGMVRLVGDKWMTEFMTAGALDLFIGAVGKPSANRTRGKSTDPASKEKAREEDASV